MNNAVAATFHLVGGNILNENISYVKRGPVNSSNWIISVSLLSSNNVEEVMNQDLLVHMIALVLPFFRY